jgi:hypothetical protein
LAIGAATSLTGLAAKPPKPEIPAIPAPNAKKSGATVKIGDPDNNDNPDTGTEYLGFSETRKSAKALGGLGRGGLAI